MNKTELTNEYKIDLVYLWVNGNDSKFKEEKNFWQKKLNIPYNSDNDDARYVDNEELRYSIRSVVKNAPWINKIYIVTNGQIPDWLDLSKTDKIKIINHKDIMPEEILPCFNSCVIETYVTRIPNLSEYFLLANDDCFINRPVAQSFFIDKNGYPVARLNDYNYTEEKLSESLYKQTILYSINLIKEKYNKELKYIPHHNIDFYSKKIFDECLEEFNTEFEKLRNQRFRGLAIQRVIFLLYQIANYETTIVSNIAKTDDKLHSDSLYVDIKAIHRLQKQILSKTPYLLCINDEPEIEHEYREQLKYLLEIMYPKKQPWENESKLIDKKKLNKYKMFLFIKKMLYYLKNLFYIISKEEYIRGT